MWELTKRIPVSLRISSVLSMVEPGAGARPSHRLRLCITGLLSPLPFMPSVSRPCFLFPISHLPSSEYLRGMSGAPPHHHHGHLLLSLPDLRHPDREHILYADQKQDFLVADNPGLQSRIRTDPYLSVQPESELYKIIFLDKFKNTRNILPGSGSFPIEEGSGSVSY